MSNDTVQLIEENIREAKEIVELGKALERLEGNRDFRKVVKEGYLEKEAIRLVHLRSDPAFQTPEKQAAVLRAIDGIGELLTFFQSLRHSAAVASKAILADEAERDEILAEGGN